MLEQVEHRRVIQVRANHPLQRRVDLGQEAADAVADGSHLAEDV